LTTEPFRPVRGIGMAAAVLMGLEAVFTVVLAIAVQPFTGSDATAGLPGALTLTITVAVPLAAAVTFIVWLYRSRRNAERLTYGDEHRHARGWVIWSWVVPIVSFWYPLQIVQDLWRAFDPAQQDRPLQARDQSGFLVAWWVAYLLMRLAAAVMVVWAWAILSVVAAAFAIVLVRRLNDLQDRTRPQEFSGPVQVHVPGA
jgi:heme/copper-type cytochrome/quinol oxidase subunit 2